jgi:predicted nucleic acid-binding protein
MAAHRYALFAPADAAFIALAEALGAPLITCDSALGKVPGHSATIEVFAAS